MIRKQLTVVLVRPQYPFNIGATARAMQNMGVERLVLVTPGCEIDLHAREGAANAQEILARRITYSCLDEFYKSEGEGLRIAFTRREGSRREPQSFIDFVKNEMTQNLQAEWSSIPIYLIFGSESDGLTTEELEVANRLCSLPVYGSYPSFNLAQAVLLSLFILQSHIQEQNSDLEISKVPLEYPKAVVDAWLTAVGFNLDLSQKWSVSNIINSLLLRAVPNKDELRLFTSVLQQNIRKLKDRNEKL